MKTRSLLVVLAMALSPNVYSATDSPTSMPGATGQASDCLGQVQTICTGLDDRLEQCLNERITQFSTLCQDQLKKMIATGASNAGLESCVNDVKRMCPGKLESDLSQCIVDNLGQFSKPCLDYMQSANLAAHS